MPEHAEEHRGVLDRSAVSGVRGSSRTAWHRHAGVLGLFALTTIAWFFPLLAHLNSSVLVGPNDETYAVRVYWGAEQDGKTPFTWKHDELNGAPEGFPFAPAVQTANVVQPGFVWLLRDVLGLYGAFNLFLLLGFALTGFAVYLLATRVGLSLLPALFAGYGVAFNPWMIERAYAGHAGYMHAWVFPVLALAHLRAHERRTVTSAAIVGLALGVSFYVSSYYGLVASLLYAVFWVVAFAFSRGWPEKRRTATLALASAAATVLSLVPAAVAWLLDRDRVAGSVTNSVEHLQSLGAAAESYVLPSTRHPLLGEITRAVDPIADKHWAENTLYVGWSTLLLAAAAVVLIARRHRAAREDVLRWFVLVAAVAIVPTAFLFSLKRETSVFGVDVPMPAYLIGELTTFWRVYARFGVLVLFGLALLAAFALHVLGRRRGGPLLVAAAIAVLVFEFVPGRVPIHRTDQPDAYARWLATQPRGIVANYPLPTDSAAALSLLASSFYQQMHHGQPNYAPFGSGYGGTREEGIRILSRYLSDPLTPGILQAEGVRYVLVHDAVYREQGDKPPDVPPGFVHRITLAGDVRVLQLREGTPAADLDALLEEHAVSIAAVQGLQAPSLEFGTGFSAPVVRDGATLRVARNGARFVIANEDERLRRARVILQARGLGAGGTLRLLADDASEVASGPVATAASPLVLGPFPIGPGRTSYVLRLEGVDEIEFAQPQVDAAADFSLSLRRPPS